MIKSIESKYTNSYCKKEFEKISENDDIMISSERVNSNQFLVDYKTEKKLGKGEIKIVEDDYFLFTYKSYNKKTEEKFFINSKLTDTPIYGHGYGEKYGLFYYKLQRQTIIHWSILPTFKFTITKRYPEIPKKIDLSQIEIEDKIKNGDTSANLVKSPKAKRKRRDFFEPTFEAASEWGKKQKKVK